MKTIYVICKDKSALYDGYINLLLYDHIETDYNKAIKLVEESKDSIFPYKIIEENINNEEII